MSENVTSTGAAVVVPEPPPLDPRARAGILALCHFLNAWAGALQALARELKGIVA